MKKLLGVLAALAVVVAITVAIFVLDQLDETIAHTIQVEGTKALGTAVSVDMVETDLVEGIAVVKGMTVANPPGYQATYAMKIDSFTAQVDYQSEVVESVLIDKPVINAELIGTKSNFETLLEGMPKNEIVAEQDAKDETVLTIKTLKLQQTQVNIISDKLGQTSFQMDDFVVHDLNGTVDQLSELITNQLIAHVSDQVKTFAVEQIKEIVKQEAIGRAKEEVNEKLQKSLKGKLGDKIKKLKFKL